VIDQDFPDPDILRVGDTSYAYATQTSNGSRNVQVATSEDLQTWEVRRTDALPQLPEWATNGRTWAPDVADGDGGYVMYLTAHGVDPDMQCIGAIDAASYVEPDGARYLLWKNDGNCCGKDTWLHLQRLSADGLRTDGPPRRLVKQDQPWEGNLVEAPTLVRHGSSYVLLYSANDYGGESYTTGYAVAADLAGPYVKGDEPLMTTDRVGVTGPGGQDVVTTPAGGQLRRLPRLGPGRDLPRDVPAAAHLGRRPAGGSRLAHAQASATPASSRSTSSSSV